MLVVMDETLAGSGVEAGAAVVGPEIRSAAAVANGEETLSPPLSPPPGFSLNFPGNFPLIFENSPILIAKLVCEMAVSRIVVRRGRRSVIFAVAIVRLNNHCRLEMKIDASAGKVQ
jgi:hypothetical protein